MSDSAASGRYEGAWIGWCERCLKHRLRIYRWVEDNGLAGDTVCWRCRRFKSLNVGARKPHPELNYAEQRQFLRRLDAGEGQVTE